MSRARARARALARALAIASGIWLLLWSLIWMVGGSAPASAHKLGLSGSVWKVESPTELGARFSFDVRDLERIVELPFIPPGSDEAAIAALVAEPTFAALARSVSLRRAGVACHPKRADLQQRRGGDVLKPRIVWTCPAGPSEGPVEISLDFLEQMSSVHRHLLRRPGQRPEARPPDQRTLSITLPPAAPPTAPPDAASSGEPAVPPAVAPVVPRAPAAQADVEPVLSFVSLGVHHILFGWDHLLFVLGLVIVARRFREVAGVITAFTIGHSITLALTVAEVVAPSSGWVEPAIAATLVAVGVENVLRPELGWRWILAGAFGLVHGMGFAGALLERDLPSDQLAAPLLGFNVGVELGQLAVVGVVYVGLVRWARLRSWYRKGVVVPVSIGVALAGLVWTVERLGA